MPFSWRTEADGKVEAALLRTPNTEKRDKENQDSGEKTTASYCRGQRGKGATDWDQLFPLSPSIMDYNGPQIVHRMSFAGGPHGGVTDRAKSVAI